MAGDNHPLHDDGQEVMQRLGADVIEINIWGRWHRWARGKATISVR